MKKVATAQQVIAVLKKAGLVMASRYSRRGQNYRGEGMTVRKGGYTVNWGKHQGSTHHGDPTPVVGQGGYHSLYAAKKRSDMHAAKRALKAAGITVVFE
jgi:hypothetical protein